MILLDTFAAQCLLEELLRDGCTWRIVEYTDVTMAVAPYELHWLEVPKGSEQLCYPRLRQLRDMLNGHARDVTKPLRALVFWRWIE